MKEFLKMMLLALLVLLPVTYSWNCILLQNKQLRDGIYWKTQNCSKDDNEVPSLTINSIHIELDRSDYRVVPAVADPIVQVQSIPDMAKQNSNFIAGINGGYFWRVDIDGFWRDNV